MLAVWYPKMRQRSAGAVLPWVYAWVIAVPLLLVGCAGLPRMHTLKAIAILTGASWEVRGKIGCRVDGNAGSVTFNWRREEETFSASFSGPLGSRRHSLTGDDTTITIRYPDASEATFSAQESVTWPDLGLSLPPAALNWWLRGIPTPKVALNKAKGGFSQHGWLISQPAVIKAPARVSGLPSMLEISKGQIFCRIRLSNWQVVGV